MAQWFSRLNLCSRDSGSNPVHCSGVSDKRSLLGAFLVAVLDNTGCWPCWEVKTLAGGSYRYKLFHPFQVGTLVEYPC